MLHKSHAHAQPAVALYIQELIQAHALTLHAGSCDLPVSQCKISFEYTCRELWFRASLAWQQILGDQSGNRNTLLVAHNAVNQALVATAIGLPPTYFRRLLQNNAATTVLDFQPTKDGPPRVNLDRLNQVRLPTQVRRTQHSAVPVLDAVLVCSICLLHLPGLCWETQPPDLFLG